MMKWRGKISYERRVRELQVGYDLILNLGFSEGSLII